MVAEEKKRPNALWMLLPIFFGIIGGIIAYLGLLNSDRESAKLLLKVGGWLTITYLAIAFLILLWIGDWWINL